MIARGGFEPRSTRWSGRGVECAVDCPLEPLSTNLALMEVYSILGFISGLVIKSVGY